MPFNSFNFWLVFPFFIGLYCLILAKYNQVESVSDFCLLSAV
jgi:hypothetical protein